MQIQSVSGNSVFKTFNTALQAGKQNKAEKNNTPNPAKSFIQQYKTPAILVTGGLALAVLTGVLVNKQNNYLAKKAKEELKALAEKSKQEETEKIQKTLAEKQKELEEYTASLKDKIAVIFQKNKPENLSDIKEFTDKHGRIIEQEKNVVKIYDKKHNFKYKAEYDETSGKLLKYGIFSRVKNSFEQLRRWENTQEGECIRIQKYDKLDNKFYEYEKKDGYLFDYQIFFNGKTFIGEKYIKEENGLREINNHITVDNYYGDYTYTSDGTFMKLREFKRNKKTYRHVEEYKNEKIYKYSESIRKGNTVITKRKITNLRTNKTQNNIIKKYYDDQRNLISAELFDQNGKFIEKREFKYSEPDKNGYCRITGYTKQRYDKPAVYVEKVKGWPEYDDGCNIIKLDIEPGNIPQK